MRPIPGNLYTGIYVVNIRISFCRTDFGGFARERNHTINYAAGLEVQPHRAGDTWRLRKTKFGLYSPTRSRRDRFW